MSTLTQERIDVPVVKKTNATLPHYASTGAAGADLTAAIDAPVTIQPGETKLIGSGLHFALPEGYEIQVRPRSGLALKHSLTVLNTPGTIDCDYRGEVGVILINHGKEAFVVEPGMRIAQLVVAPVTIATFSPTDNLDETARGAGGFGHTGTH